MWHIEIDWIIKIVLSIVLGGLIGFERESLKRPAGLRTHILVAIGATLVSSINTNIIEDLNHLNNISIAPARYGAAVISGIGFLGAGTIIKEGTNVKGLTTAAGLWAVACIGLVVGHGYYSVAITATVLVFSTLKILMHAEDRYAFSRRTIKLKILVKGKLGVIGDIGDIFDTKGITIIKMSVNSTEEEKQSLITIRLRYSKRTRPIDILNSLENVEGIINIEESHT